MFNEPLLEVALPGLSDSVVIRCGLADDGDDSVTCWPLVLIEAESEEVPAVGLTE